MRATRIFALPAAGLLALPAAGLLALLSVACQPAASGPVEKPPAARAPAPGFAMHHVDHDKDQRASKKEVQHAAGRKFGQLDADGSGRIEIAKECKPLFVSFCHKADKNGDGHVDRQEFLDHADDHFHAADKDKNGHLSHQELHGVEVFHW